MPRLLHHALAPLVGGGCARVRVDLQKDFMDTPAAQEKRWLKRFGDDLVKDLQGILPVKCPPTPHPHFLSATVCSLPRLWAPKCRPRRCRRRRPRGVARARALSRGAKVLDLAACAAAEEGERLTTAGDARTRMCYHPDVAEWACHASHLAVKTEEVCPRRVRAPVRRRSTPRGAEAARRGEAAGRGRRGGRLGLGRPAVGTKLAHRVSQGPVCLADGACAAPAPRCRDAPCARLVDARARAAGGAG